MVVPALLYLLVAGGGEARADGASRWRPTSPWPSGSSRCLAPHPPVAQAVPALPRDRRRHRCDRRDRGLLLDDIVPRFGARRRPPSSGASGCMRLGTPATSPSLRPAGGGALDLRPRVRHPRHVRRSRARAPDTRPTRPGREQHPRSSTGCTRGPASWWSHCSPWPRGLRSARGDRGACCSTVARAFDLGLVIGKPLGIVPNRLPGAGLASARSPTDGVPARRGCRRPRGSGSRSHCSSPTSRSRAAARRSEGGRPRGLDPQRRRRVPCSSPRRVGDQRAGSHRTTRPARDRGRRTRAPSATPAVGEPRPRLDDDGLLRFRNRWVAVPDAQLAVVALLLDRDGCTVPDDELSAAYAHHSPDAGPRAYMAAMHRLAWCVKGCCPRAPRVRGRGYLLAALPTASIQEWAGMPSESARNTVTSLTRI